MSKRLFLCALALGAATLAHAQQTPPSMTEQHRTIRQGLEAERVPLKELIPAYGDAVASTYVQGSQCKTTISEAMPPLGNEKAHMKEVVIDWTKVTALKSQDDLPGWIIVGREGFADDQFFYAKASFSAVAQAMIDLVKACGAPAAANYAPKADVDPHAAHAPTTARAPVAKSAPASAAKAPVARSTPAPAAAAPARPTPPATEADGWPALTGVSPEFARNIRDCRTKMNDPRGERFFEYIQLRPDDTNAAGEIAYARDRMLYALTSNYEFYCVDDELVETDADVAAYRGLKASAEAIAPGIVARAEQDFIARANSIILAKKPSISQSQLQSELDAVIRYSKMTNFCGTPDLSTIYLDRYSQSSVNNFNARQRRNVDIGNCLKDYWDSRGAKSPKTSDAYGWTHRAKFFTCDKWRTAACVPTSEFSPLWKYTSDEATARKKAYEDAYYNDQRDKAYALNERIGAWLADVNRRYPN